MIQTLYRTASYLTEPVCYAHACFRHLQLIKYKWGTVDKVNSLVYGAFFAVRFVVSAALSVVATAPGALCRRAAMALQKQPFLVHKEEGEGKRLSEGRAFSVFSWNICCVSGGYAISDGGVREWPARINRIIDRICETDADVNCLYEVFDWEAMVLLRDRLKERGYPHIYYNIGPKAVGVSSGIFMASKYAVSSAEFTPFPKSMLVGRTKRCEKGVFRFDLQSEGEVFATLFATHLQHSQVSARPEVQDVRARSEEMQFILEKVDQIRERAVLVLGDLNMSLEEFQGACWAHRFVNAGAQRARTWKGDGFCARFMGQEVSGPLVLDYVLLVNETTASVETHLVDARFDPEFLSNQALSDHEGLLTTIKLAAVAHRELVA
jgi:endonuclease/exonuclease/phosphatase family metal-dependent hydrolase